MTWQQQSWRNAPGETVPSAQRHATLVMLLGRLDVGKPKHIFR